MAAVSILFLGVASLPAAQGLRTQPPQKRLKWGQRQQNKPHITIFGESMSRGQTDQGQKNKTRAGRLFAGSVSYPINLIRDPRCNPYEMCKCNLGESERDSHCQESSCVYSPLAPPYCKLSTPECKWGKKKVQWHRCEFANTLSTTFYPNQNIFVALRTKQQESATPARGARVFTDIDGTVMCTGGPGRSGLISDCKLMGTANGLPFPGVAAFYLALTQGNLAEQPSGKQLMKPLPFTARPHELKLLLGLRRSIYSLTGGTKALKEAFAKEGPPEWTLDIAGASYGRLLDILDHAAIVGHRGDDATEYDKIAYRKFSAYKYLYDEKYNNMGVQGSFFVGDNGQGDLVAAQMMLSYGSRQKPGLRAAFILDSAAKCDKDCHEEWKKYGIYIIQDYAQAASIAFDEGLITEASKKHVCLKANNTACSSEWRLALDRRHCSEMTAGLWKGQVGASLPR